MGLCEQKCGHLNTSVGCAEFVSWAVNKFEHVILGLFKWVGWRHRYKVCVERFFVSIQCDVWELVQCL